MRKRTFSMCINIRKCKCDMARRFLQNAQTRLAIHIWMRNCEPILPHSKIFTFGRTKSNSKNTSLEIAFQEKPFRVSFIVSSAQSHTHMQATRHGMRMRYTKILFTQFCNRRFVAAVLLSQQPPSEIQLNINFSCAYVCASERLLGCMCANHPVNALDTI